jgi:GTPase
VQRSRNGRNTQTHKSANGVDGGGVSNPRARQRALAIGIIDGREPGAPLAELKELLRTAGVATAGEATQQRPKPDPDRYFGRGRLDELKEQIVACDANLVACDDELAPRQERNLEAALGVPVIDRTAVILDIFADHAHSAEGKLQVELAQLEYNMARMRGLWTHLERLGAGRMDGGIGTRGPGETQIETDRRLARNRISVLRRRLEEIKKQRATQRKERQRSETPTIALAGYTNVGKSTLLNALTGSDVSVENQLFHTLDPTTRGFEHDGRRYLLTDTVGFIRRLPHQLVEGFASTLEETLVADMVLHVVDAAAPDDEQDRQRAAVDDVLQEIGAGELPVEVVLNKIDRVDALARRRLANRFPGAAQVSALTGEGLDELRLDLARRFDDRWERVRLLVPYEEGARLSELYALGTPIEEREDTAEGVAIIARLPRRDLPRFAPFLVAEAKSRRESA